MGFKDKLSKATQFIKEALEETEPTPEDLFEVTTYCSAYYFTENVEKLYKLINMPVTNDYIMGTGKPLTKVYKYKSLPLPITLEFDPKNEYDKNAIKVTYIYGFDHIQLSFISRDENEEIGKYLKSNKIYNINATLYGGPYKVPSETDTVEAEDNYKLVISLLVRK